jgi:malonyl-CoA/methylmalonyl-CoA synthetase
MDMLEALRRGAGEGRILMQAGPGPGVTYAEALTRAGGFATALARRGVQPGDRVAVQVQKVREAIWLYLGCLRAGAVFLPLNPGYTPVETRYFLDDAEVALFVADAERVAQMAAELPPGRCLSLADLTAEAVPGEFDDHPAGPEALAAILYTSGTTGRSKGVMLSRGNLSSNADTLAQVWAFGPDDVLLHALPIFHTHGLFVATNTVLAAGASMIFLPAFQPDAVFAALPRASVMMGVPTFYTRLLADGRLTRDAVAHVRLFVSGSAPLSAATHRDWAARTGTAILERYGMTETNMNTSNPHDGERRAGTVGFALPGVELRVTDPVTGAPLPLGEVGLIEVRGPNVFAGYWRAPEKTAAEFRADGFFMTGDMGRVDGDGYLSIVGRSKDLVISGGLNVYPAEVEGALDDLAGIAASAVIGVPHPDLGEAVVAVVIPAPGAMLSEDAIRVALRDRLAAFKIPKRVIMVPDLPRNAMGKVQKNVLRSDQAGLFAGAGGAA